MYSSSINYSVVYGSVTETHGVSYYTAINFDGEIITTFTICKVTAEFSGSGLYVSQGLTSNVYYLPKISEFRSISEDLSRTSLVIVSSILNNNVVVASKKNFSSTYGTVAI